MERRIEPDGRRVRIVHGGRTIAETTGAVRVFEGGPPAYYVPRDDVEVPLERSTAESTTCPWKGAATYWGIDGGDAIAWSYEAPLADAEPLRDHVAFYASRVDECWVGDQRVAPQRSRYYGGWIVDEAEA